MVVDDVVINGGLHRSRHASSYHSALNYKQSQIQKMIKKVGKKEVLGYLHLPNSSLFSVGTKFKSDFDARGGGQGWEGVEKATN